MSRYSESKYAVERLSDRRDDRQDRSKLMRDAELRGSLGVREANKVIAAIDRIKMER